MGGPLLIAVLFSIAAWARYSDADLAKRKVALGKVLEAAAYADSELPPCEDLGYLANAVAPYDPPAKECPKAHAFFAAVADWGTHAQKNCREEVALAEDALRDPRLCETAPPVRSALYSATFDHSLLLRRDTQETLTKLDPLGDGFADDSEGQAPQGELKNMDCEIGLLVTMQFRRRALTLMTKLYGKADISLDIACDKSGRVEFFDFARYGERAFREK